MTRSEIRRHIVVHNSPGFRGKAGRVTADLINYTACQLGRKERAVAREITSIVIMDCYGEIVVYLDLRGGDSHGGETVVAHYWIIDLKDDDIHARTGSPPILEA